MVKRQRRKQRKMQQVVRVPDHQKDVNAIVRAIQTLVDELNALTRPRSKPPGSGE
jgi:hypothetical protein